MEGLLLFLGEIKYKLLGFTAIASGLALLKFRYLSGKKCESNVRLDGRVVIITGSNTGIGFYTALDLAGRGATVIMACRDLNKANKACNYIKKETRNQNVYVELVDLSSFDSVVEFSERIIKKYDKIDILINNAGSFLSIQDGF
jgi:NADP-dependent 3-hydroxy acid dehydrogenase YdfG